MILIPAIDLRGGKVVRLTQGDFSKETIYSEDAPSIAKKWQDEGAEWLHIVDLDGAREGKPVNLDTLKKIRKAVSVSIEFGGGIRKDSTVGDIFGIGINRIVIGTKVLDEKWTDRLLGKHGDKIAIGIDFKSSGPSNFAVSTSGWLESEQLTKKELSCKIKGLEDQGAQCFIFTDITRDGTFEGPNEVLLKTFLEITKAKVILSGGISSLEDIELLKELRHKILEGVIVGKALYEGTLSLKEALNALKRGKGGNQ